MKHGKPRVVLNETTKTFSVLVEVTIPFLAEGDGEKFKVENQILGPFGTRRSAEGSVRRIYANGLQSEIDRCAHKNRIVLG
jgi:hypothetical protein